MADRTNKSKDYDEYEEMEESYEGGSFLDIADLKEMNISKLTQIAKDLSPHLYKL